METLAIGTGCFGIFSNLLEPIHHIGAYINDLIIVLNLKKYYRKLVFFVDKILFKISNKILIFLIVTTLINKEFLKYI